MVDSLSVARITVMMLRASISNPDSLGARFGVILSPDTIPLSLAAALEQVGTLSGLLTFAASAKGGNLVISVEEPTESDRLAADLRIRNFQAAWRSLKVAENSDRLVEVRGYDDTILVPVRVIQDWLRFANCRSCTMALSPPSKGSPPDVVALLNLGRRRGR